MPVEMYRKNLKAFRIIEPSDYPAVDRIRKSFTRLL